MEKFGIKIERDNVLRNFNIKSGNYFPTFHVPSDLSSASMIVRKVVSEGKIRMSGLNFDLPQGDSSDFQYCRTNERQD